MIFLPAKRYDTQEGVLIYIGEGKDCLYFSDLDGWIVECEKSVIFEENFIELN